MNYKDFLSRLSKDSLYKNIIIYGDESYHIDEAIDKLIAKYIDKNFMNFNVIKYEDINKNEDDFKRLINDISTVPLMSSKKIIVIESSEFITSKSSFKHDENAFLNMLNRKDDDVFLILLIKEGKPDARKKIVKDIKKNNSIFEFERLSKFDFSKYLSKIFSHKQIEISNMDVEYIAENSGYLDYETDKTLYDVNNELRKLVSFAHNQKKLSREDIDALMHKSLNTNIFNLVDSICGGNKKRAFSILEDMLLSGVNEQYIIYMLYRQYRLMLNYKLLAEKNCSYKDILIKMHTKDFILKKIVKSTGKLSSKDIISKLLSITDVDRRIKIGKLTSKYGVEILCSSL